MPTYQYECGACGHGFEALQSMVDKKLKKCPQCGKSKLHRLIGTGSGIIFKGTGFYETDYKRKDAPSSPNGAFGRRGPTSNPEGSSSPEEPGGRVGPATRDKPAASTKGSSPCCGGCACSH